MIPSGAIVTDFASTKKLTFDGYRVSRFILIVFLHNVILNSPLSPDNLFLH